MIAWISIFLTLGASAATFETRIYKAISPDLLLLENGRVGFIQNRRQWLDISELQDKAVEVELDDEGRLLSIRSIRSGTHCTFYRSYRPKSCAGFGIP
jgi:hypothetical protein